MRNHLELLFMESTVEMEYILVTWEEDPNRHKSYEEAVMVPHKWVNRFTNLEKINWDTGLIDGTDQPHSWTNSDAWEEEKWDSYHKILFFIQETDEGREPKRYAHRWRVQCDPTTGEETRGDKF